MKRQSKVTVEIALSDAIFVFNSAARAQLESEYQGKKLANQTKVPFVGTTGFRLTIVLLRANKKKLCFFVSPEFSPATHRWPRSRRTLGSRLHFKEMAKDLCLSFTIVNRLVLRGSERNIEFQATNKRVHKYENRGEKSHAVLLSTSQLYSPQVPNKRWLEPNISRL